MYTKNDYRKDYLPPELGGMIIISETVFAASDWNAAAIEDEFVEMYDL